MTILTILSYMLVCQKYLCYYHRSHNFKRFIYTKEFFELYMLTILLVTPMSYILWPLEKFNQLCADIVNISKHKYPWNLYRNGHPMIYFHENSYPESWVVLPYVTFLKLNASTLLFMDNLIIHSIHFIRFLWKTLTISSFTDKLIQCHHF
jgi:hypothetical protein